MTSIFGRFKPNNPPRYRKRDRDPKPTDHQRIRKVAQRQVKLLEAIAAQPGKTAIDYARLIGTTPQAVEADLKKFLEDETVIIDKSGFPVWYIKPIDTEVKPCTLN